MFQSLAGKRIIIVGAGTWGKLFYVILEETVPSSHVEYFLDNNVEGELQGIPIAKIDFEPFVKDREEICFVITLRDTAAANYYKDLLTLHKFPNIIDSFSVEHALSEYKFSKSQYTPPHFMEGALLEYRLSKLRHTSASFLQMLEQYKKETSISIFIETGTLLGDTINQAKDIFEQVYSIELSEDLYTRACKRFEHNPNVHLIHGDSAVELDKLLQKIVQPCIFYLDGHYSGGITAKGITETPILTELSTIIKSPVKNHVILIDDARLFNGAHDYPTIDLLIEFLDSHSLFYSFLIDYDVIQIRFR